MPERSAGWERGGIDAASTDTPTWFREPTYGQRLGGMLLDALLIGVCGGVAVVLVGDSPAGAAASLAVSFVYATSFTARTGRTPGKLAAGTCVVGLGSGDLPTLRQASVRWLVVIAASLVALVLPAIAAVAPFYGLAVLAPVLGAPLHQGLHDRASDTVVTSVRPPG